MIVCGNILILVFLCLEATGQHRARNPRQSGLSQRNQKKVLNVIQPGEKEEIKKKLAQVDQILDKLNIEKQTLKKNIEHLKKGCAQEVKNLNNKQEEMMTVLNERQKIMLEIFKKIQEEEAEHIRLEAELKKLSEALEVSEQQFIVLDTDLNLMKRRRSNGTTARCNLVTTALAADEKNSMTTRAHLINPYKVRTKTLTAEARALLVMKSQLGIKETLKDQVLASVKSSEMELKSVKELCQMRKASVNALIVQTNNEMAKSQKSLDILTNDLKIFKALSETVRLEIKTGMNFIIQFKEKMVEVKKSAQDYKDDEACFRRITSMD